MAFTRKQKRVLKVCWKWIFPYPCWKTVSQYCCTGPTLIYKYPFVTVKYICCSGKEYRFISFRFGFSFSRKLYQICEHCTRREPTPYRQQCRTAGKIDGYSCPDFEVTL